MVKKTRTTAPPLSEEDTQQDSSSTALSTALDITKLSPEHKELFRCLTLYFEQLMTKKDEKIKKLEDHVNNLKNRVDSLEREIDENAAYLRRETLIASGEVPNCTPNENCKAIIVTMLQEVKLNVNANDISVAHRIGHPRKQGPDRRNIFFKLCRRDLKYDILNACRQHRPKFYINESLTPNRNKILLILRRARKKHPTKIKSIRSYDGSISVYLSPIGRQTPADLPLSQLRRITVNTRRELDVLLERELQTTVEELDLL